MKEFKGWLGIACMFLVTGGAAYASIKPYYQDIKLPTQQMIEHQTIASPTPVATGVPSELLSGVAGPTSGAATSITSFSGQPDVARNVVLTTGGTANDINASTVVVSGTNIFGKAISENFGITLHQAGATTGAKAFATITSVAFPLNAEGGSFGGTWSLGLGSKLGLKRCMAAAGYFMHSNLNGVKEATAATIAASASAVESNTAQLNSALNNTNVDLFFMQNYQCFP